MGTSTAYLNLYKTNMLADGDDFFDFKRDLDDNWDKIDTCCVLMNTAVSTKANSALDNLTDDGKAKFDGKWTNTNHIIVFEGRDLSTSSTLVPFTLDFLPDNGEYEILFTTGVQLIYNNTYCYGSIDISSDIINNPFPCVRISGSASTGHVYIKGTIILPVKNKKIYLSGETENRNSKGDLTAIAYRKLGVGFETTNESEVTQDE